MFPLSDLGVLALTASAPFLAGALTGILRRRWAVLALVLAGALFHLVYFRHALATGNNQGAGLAAAVFGAIFLIAWLFGEIWGLALRFLRRRVGPGLGVAGLICALPALSASGWVLQRQYVPESCMGGLAVSMRETGFRLDIGDAARLSWQPGGSGEVWDHYSARQQHKDSLSRLCRMEKPVDPHEISLGTPGVRVTSCAPGSPCFTTDTSEFRLEIVATENPPKPSAWFGDKLRGDIRWSGTPEDGWICFLPNGSFTWVSCQRWILAVPGVRAIASADLEAGAEPEEVAEALGSVIDEWLKKLAPDRAGASR